ncbi:MAG: orotate phosphoribosyltransferase [Gemmatimonadota bacterium]|nr:MAG: orotate phosphoribosyltransferase [Gemmatimonadota bacterium]
MEKPQSASHAKLVALLKQRSVELGSFTLASGRQSSYYIDARRTTMSASGQRLIGDLGLSRMRQKDWDAQVVGGMTLGADPVAYAIARASSTMPPEIDAFTVRKEPKGHGKGQQIEGCFRPGSRVVVVEDVVTTGGSALKAIEAVTAAGGKIVGVLAVVDREEGGRAAVEQAGYDMLTLVSLSQLGITTAGG